MEKKMRRGLLLAVVLGLVFVMGAFIPQKASAAEKVTAKEYQKSKTVKAGKTELFTYDIKAIKSVTVKGNKKVTKAVNEYIKFNNDIIDLFLSEETKEAKRVYKKTPKAFKEQGKYEFDVEMTYEENGNFLTISVDTLMQELGMANPETGVGVALLDLRTGELVSGSDIIKEGNTAAIKKMIKAYAKANNIVLLDDINWNSLLGTLSVNLGIVDGKAVLVFNPAEIAPAYNGVIRVPVEGIDSCLTDYGKEVVNTK